MGAVRHLEAYLLPQFNITFPYALGGFVQYTFFPFSFDDVASAVLSRASGE
jgi:hypothetical protein